MAHPRRVAVLTAVVLAAVASPLVTDADGFPISNLRMFSARRPRVVSLAHFIAVDERGRERPAPPSSLGTREVVAAMALAAKAAASGPSVDARALCERVRARQRARTVVLRVDTFDAIDYFRYGRVPLRTREVLRCEGADPR